ncbi:MAG: tRNA lysidine(34) synthetase TilS [Actinomycetota bacterium]
MSEHPPRPEPGATPATDPITIALVDRCTFPASGTSVVCGVSGGADSLALLVLATAAGLHVTAVHVDHGLRPDSAAEARVVSSAAARFGAAFRAERTTVDPGADLEQRARIVRHALLGPDAMTGHTADDQAETLLINLLRGAGPAGLAAMAPGHRHPILALRRTDTERLCHHWALQPVRDPSNEDPRFVRNRVRHELLPLMSDISQRDPVPLLVRSAEHARQTTAEIERRAADLVPTDSRALAAQPGVVAAAALRRWLRNELGHPPSSAELDRVMAVVRHEVVACELSGGRRITRQNGLLRLDRSP